MKESTIEARLVKGAKQAGWLIRKFVSPGNAGVPDRMLISPDGHLIFVELKTETGRLTALQSAQIAMLRRYKQDVRVLYVNMTRDEQNRIKDVGGFVGGTLKNGHRSGKTVTGRTILSYDIDFASFPRLSFHHLWPWKQTRHQVHLRGKHRGKGWWPTLRWGECGGIWK